MTRAAAATLLVSLVAPLAAAEAPGLTNGRLEPSSAAAGLDPVLRKLIAASSAPAWIGWSVPAARPHDGCCWDSGQGGCSLCRLEDKGGSTTASSAPAARPHEVAPLRLEPSRELLVLLRVEAGEPSRIRGVAAGCALDVGGLTLHWLEDVRAADSVRWLSTLTSAPGEARGTRRLANQALAALASHAAPEALDTLLERAGRAESSHVRGQALFWLSQRAGERAVGAIARAVADDPETEVKKKAVFALSQLPKDEGVPLLIQTALTNRNPAVRKQAFFWLGQSKDERALAFFEAVLK